MQTVRHNGEKQSHIFIPSFFFFHRLQKLSCSLERNTKRTQKEHKNICGACLSSSCHASFLSLYLKKISIFIFLQFSNEFAHILIIMRSTIFLFFFYCMPIFKTLQKQYYFFCCVYIFAVSCVSIERFCSKQQNKYRKKIAIELRDFNFVCASIL